MQKGTLSTLAVTAAAAVAVAGVAYGTSSSDDAVAADGDTAHAPQDLRRILLPAEDHPAGEVRERAFDEAAEEGAFALPDGMVTHPEVCTDYLARVLRDAPEEANGWIQSTPHDQYGPDEGPHHFTSFVVEVPGGADVAAIAEAAAQCRDGEITLAGTVSGRVANETDDGLPLDRAETAALTQHVAFPPPRDGEEAAVLARYYGPSEDGVDSDTRVHLVGMGEVLLLVLATDSDFAAEVAQASYERAQMLGIVG